MRHAKSICRVSGLAVGLGIGAAGSATPWIAYADDAWPQPDPSIAADVGFLLPSNPAAAGDIAISVDGFTLFQQGTATATSGMGDIAIAIGANSSASALGGWFDSAFADGAGSVASVGFGTVDSAFANGVGAVANAGFGNFDAASANGNGSLAAAEFGNGDLATALGNGSTAEAWFGNSDLASVLGDNSAAIAGGTSATVLGNNDIATVFDPFGTVGSTATAGGVEDFPGNFDLGAVFGDMLNSLHAVGGDLLVDILP